MPLTSRAFRFSVALAVGLISTGPGRSADLAGLVNAALASDPIYAGAIASRDASLEARPQARANLLPSVSASLGENATRIDLRPADTPLFVKTYNAWGPGINVNMTLYSAANWDTLDQADLIGQQADRQLDQARNNLYLRSVQAYFDVLAAQDALTALQENRKAILEQREQAHKEFEVGTKTAVDMQEAQARLDQADAQMQLAEADLSTREGALSLLTGKTVDALNPLADDLQLQAPEPDNLTRWLDLAKSDNPQVLSAQAGRQIAQRQVRIAHDAGLPVVSLAGSIQYQKSDNYSVFLPINSATTQSSLGIQVSIPVFAGGAIQSRVREASAKQVKAEKDLDLAERSAQQDARQGFLGVQAGLRQIRFLESAVQSSRIQRDSTQLGYRVGVRINLDVLNAQTQLINTQRDLKKARYDFIVNALKLKAAAGVLASADIDHINRLLSR
jgi:outer membrane protein